MERSADGNLETATLAILYVEDCRIQRHLLARMAATLDADITLQAAGSLAEALGLCASRHFDAVLLDLMLADSQGVATLERMHAALPRVPIIVLTATDDRALALQLLARGAQDYLLQDQIDGATLLRAIRYAIERKRIAIQLEEETARLRESEARMTWLFEQSPVPLYEFDLGSGLPLLPADAREGLSSGSTLAFLDEIRIVAANRAALALSRAESIADFKSVASLVPAHSLPALGRALAHLAGGETPPEFEAYLRRLDGEERNVRVGVALVADPQRQGNRVIVSAVDLTERKRAELQLQLQAIALESTVYAVVITDVEGRILWVNPAFSELTGYSREEAMGRNPRVLKSGVHDAGFYRQMWQRLRAGKVWEGEVVNRRRGGSLYTEHMTITPVRADGEAITHFIAIKYDVSERKALEAKLIQSQKLESIGQLAAGVAHEINTPIQFIGDNLRFLKDAFIEILPRLGQAAPAEAETARAELADLAYYRDELPRAIEDSLEGVEHVAKIVRSMKAFSHPGTSDMTGVDINSVIDNAVTISRNEWKYVADLALELAPELPLVPGLPGELGQVFLNMIVNAAQAIESALGERPQEKGRIAISSARKGEAVQIRVSDSGCGIPPEHQSQIFDLFFTTKDVGKGSGQGLALAHAVVVEQHGGSISVESALGQGTTFIVELPMARQEAELQPQPVA
jgi:PAS domain S-box-containing protein